MTEQERTTRVNQLMDALRLSENAQVSGTTPVMYQNKPTFEGADRDQLKAELKKLLITTDPVV